MLFKESIFYENTNKKLYKVLYIFCYSNTTVILIIKLIMQKSPSKRADMTKGKIQS